MRNLSVFWAVATALSMLLAVPAAALSAVELPVGNLAGLLRGSPTDIHPPQSCDQCDKEFCVQRTPVTECVRGKKEVYDCETRCQYVSVPETRYRWVTRLVTKKIPCPYCMPTCETTEVEHRYESERWDTHDLGCGKLHCKSCEAKTETLPCKHCGRKPGETNVKVRYWTCVKEPYIVYRQVKKPICVKRPRYERVDVRVTRHVCQRCGDPRCDHGGGCGECGTGGCEDCGQ